MNRPPTGSMRVPGTATRRPPGTASRLTAAMNSNGSGTGIRGGPVAGGVALNSQVTVVDRPMTQQGLAMKTSRQGGRRQIMDKTYFLGQIRSKINELNMEIGRLSKEIGNASEENSSYLAYEKRAEILAGEIRDLQGELGDYNTLVDKLTTDEDIRDVEFDCNNLKSQNDRENTKIEELFDIKKQKEDQILLLETEMTQERQIVDNLVNDMNPDMRQRYLQLKDLNGHWLKQLEAGQQELDQLNSKIEILQEDLSQSVVKQEALRLYNQLHDLEAKRDSLLADARKKGSPAEERERLLKQVKEDNLEIASMDRQIKEIQVKIDAMREEIAQLDMDIDENQGERNQKYMELKKREQVMDDFIGSFESNKILELKKISDLEAHIVSVLQSASRNMGNFTNLPTPKDLISMKEDLDFKKNEMKKSELTTAELSMQREGLQHDLAKMDQFEEKLREELVTLKKTVCSMENDLSVFSDIDQLKSNAKKKKQRLIDDRTNLKLQKETFKKRTSHLNATFETLKSELNENETYTQLSNLEKKWQHLEQNNFAMKEFIAARTDEGDCTAISQRVYTSVAAFNNKLQSDMSGKSSL